MLLDPGGVDAHHRREPGAAGRAHSPGRAAADRSHRRGRRRTRRRSRTWRSPSRPPWRAAPSSPTTRTSSATSCRASSRRSSAERRYLDTQDLLAIAHPDAADLRLETFTRELLGSEERHRALSDALDTLRVMSDAAVAAGRGDRRYAIARAALETFAPEAPWLPLARQREAARRPTPARAVRRDPGERRGAGSLRRGCHRRRTGRRGARPPLLPRVQGARRADPHGAPVRPHALRRRDAAARGRHRRRQVPRLPGRRDSLRDGARRRR